MKFVLRMALSAAFAVAIAATASAQRPGGAGGFGGGFAISAYSLVSTNKVLQDELKVTDDQKKKLEEAMKPIAEKRRELFTAGGGGGQNQTEEQRKERAEKMAKLSEETKTAVESALEEKQKTRLSEINIQVQGFAAFSSKAVQEKLKLTDAQKEKVKAVAETYQKDAAELRKDAPMTRRGGGAQPSEEDMKKAAEYRKKSDALKAEAEDKVKAELTGEQKDSWKKMVGEKFDTTKLLQGGFGGGQRPGGNRQRPNN